MQACMSFKFSVCIFLLILSSFHMDHESEIKSNNNNNIR